MRQFTPAPDTTIFWHNVYLGRERFGPVHLAVGHSPHKGEFWYVMSDRPTDESAFATHDLRMDLEELIRDDKSGGFHVEASMLQDEHMLDQLMLVLVNQGVAVVKKDKRRLVDTHWYQGSSYFCLGPAVSLAGVVVGLAGGSPLASPIKSGPGTGEGSSRTKATISAEAIHKILACIV